MAFALSASYVTAGCRVGRRRRCDAGRDAGRPVRIPAAGGADHRRLSNPLYSLLIAYTNDYLDYDDMPAASGGLVFINGLGAIAGPVTTGWLMSDGVFGPPGFFFFIASLMFATAAYAAYRATQRPSTPVEETSSMAYMYPTASPVAIEMAQEVAFEADQEAEEQK
ncbi:hypothetical protein [Ruegeria pomeroyi]|uniref:hypothetical protein n=1 Tax=Ruegeria pomeroyi TaxID=89184 RepID=UPI0039A5F37F